MANLTYAQLEGLWIQNGGSPATAPVAAAIAEAESGGNPASTSANPDGGTNVGLWQLDTKGKGAGLSAAQLADPNVNASAAVGGSRNGADWSAWQTYASGAYKAFLSTSTTPSAAGLPQASGGLIGPAAVVAQSNVCVIPYPSLNLGFATAGGGCLLSKSQARAIVGAMLIMTALPLAIAGAVILAAAAFEHSGASRAVGQVAGMVPGTGTTVRAATRAAPPPRSSYGTVPNRPPVANPQGGPPKAGPAYGRRPYYPRARKRP